MLIISIRIIISNIFFQFISMKFSIVSWNSKNFMPCIFNCASFVQGNIAIATFGPTTAKAVRDAGLRLDLEAPSEKYPSMTGALLHYLLEHDED